MGAPAIRVCVDIMGGDFAPRNIIDGVKETLDDFGDAYHLLLVGPQETIEEGLKRVGLTGDPRLEIVPASQVIEMGEHPVSAVRTKSDSSICVSMDLVRTKRADAVFSAGNTGACVAAALLRMGRIPGIERPALATFFPSEQEPFLLLDSGATVDCKASWLMQYALMGSIFMEKVMGRPSPKVGLLSNGTEKDKGCKLTQEAFELLDSLNGRCLNFIGNVEGHGLFAGDMDVVVCDGFVGNVFLKTGEQLSLAIGHIIKNDVKKHPLRMLGAMLMKGSFGVLKKKTAYEEHGGAPLLGVAGTCIIGHGISNAKAVKNGIKMAGMIVANHVSDIIAEQVKSLGTMEN